MGSVALTGLFERFLEKSVLGGVKFLRNQTEERYRIYTQV